MLFGAAWKPGEGRVPVPEISGGRPSAAESPTPQLGAPQLAREVFSPQGDLPLANGVREVSGLEAPPMPRRSLAEALHPHESGAPAGAGAAAADVYRARVLVRLRLQVRGGHVLAQLRPVAAAPPAAPPPAAPPAAVPPAAPPIQHLSIRLLRHLVILSCLIWSTPLR